MKRCSSGVGGYGLYGSLRRGYQEGVRGSACVRAREGSQDLKLPRAQNPAAACSIGFLTPVWGLDVGQHLRPKSYP